METKGDRNLKALKVSFFFIILLFMGPFGGPLSVSRAEEAGELRLTPEQLEQYRKT